MSHGSSWVVEQVGSVTAFMSVVTAGFANLCSFVIVCSRTVEMQFPVAASHTADAQTIDFWFGLLF